VVYRILTTELSLSPSIRPYFDYRVVKIGGKFRGSGDPAREWPPPPSALYANV